MAGSLGDLVVRLKLDAADYTTTLTKAEQSADRFANSTTQALERTNREIKKTNDAVDYLKGAFTKIAAAVGITEIVRLNDEFTNVSARLKIVTANSEDFARVQNILFETANRTRTSYGATANLFYRLSTATLDLGTSQSQLLTITDKLNKALVISGATGSTAKGALEQLSQALGANQLRGQEFNTVNEQGNRIIRALADGLGKTVGELREMANNGELTTEVFIRGFLKGAEKLDDEFSKIPVTISGAFQVAENELQKFVGTTAQASGGGTLLASSIVTIAKNIDILAAAAIGFGATKLASIIFTNVAAFEASTVAALKNIAAERATGAAKLETIKAELARIAATEAAIVAARAQTVAELNLTQALVAKGAVSRSFTTAAIADLAALGAAQTALTAKQAQLSAAQAALTASSGATAVASGLVSRAIGFLGGPIGAVTTLLGLGVTAWQLYGSISEQNAQKAANSTKLSTESILSNLDLQIARLKSRNQLAGQGLPKSVVGNIAPDDLDRLNELKAEIAKRQALVGKKDNTGGLVDPGAEPAIIELQARVDAIIGRYKTLATEQDKLSNRTTAEKLSGFWKDYANNAEKAQNALKEMADQVGLTVEEFSKQNPELVKRVTDKFKDKTKVDDPTKKEIEGELKFIEAQIAREKDLLQSREAFLRDTYSEGLLSVKNYYDNLSSARAENLTKTLEAYDREIDVAEQFKKRKGVKQTEIADADNKIADIRSKKANAERDAASLQTQLDRDREKSVREYLESLDELSAKLSEINGRTADAAAIRFDAANRVLKNLLRSSGDEVGLQQLETIRQQTIVQAQLTDQAKKYGVIQGYLSLEQEKLNNLRSVGALGEISFLVKASQANADYLEVMKQLAEQYDKIAEKSKDPADLLKAKQMKEAVDQLARSTDLLGEKFNNILGDAFADNITALVTGAKSLKDAVKDFGKQVNDQIVGLIAQQFKADLFGQGGFLSGIGKQLSELFGGKVAGIAGAVDPSKLLNTGADAAKQASELATQQALLLSATSLTASGGELTLAATSLLSAGVSLDAAAAALIASAAGSAAGDVAGSIGRIVPLVAGGGPGYYAGGTSYAPGGMAVVGENGPELVNLPVGSRVTPNGRMRSTMGGAVINIYQTVQPGADTASFRQKALDAASALQTSWKNR